MDFILDFVPGDAGTFSSGIFAPVLNYISVFHDSFYVAGTQILYTHPLYGVAISPGSYYCPGRRITF